MKILTYFLFSELTKESNEELSSKNGFNKIELSFNFTNLTLKLTPKVKIEDLNIFLDEYYTGENDVKENTKFDDSLMIFPALKLTNRFQILKSPQIQFAKEENKILILKFDLSKVLSETEKFCYLIQISYKNNILTDGILHFIKKRKSRIGFSDIFFLFSFFYMICVFLHIIKSIVKRVPIDRTEFYNE